MTDRLPAAPQLFFAPRARIMEKYNTANMENQEKSQRFH